MLYKNIDEVKKYLPLSNAVEFERLKPHIVQIENEFIVPLMGEAQYEDINAFYNANAETALFLNLFNVVRAAQNAIIHLVYFRGYEVLNAYISDGGFKRVESDKVKSLFKYQEDNLKEYFKTCGFNALDIMLEKMEVYAKASGNTAINQPWYKAYHDDFINNAKAFSEIYEINGSRLIFLRLKKYMQQVKDLELSKVLGPVNWDYILSEIAKTDAASPAAKVKAILPLIRKPLAFLSVALLMEDTGADLTDKGLVYDGKISQNGGDVAKVPAEKVRVLNLIARNRAIGEAYLTGLKQYLLEHASDWNAYSAPAGSVMRRDNGGKRTFFS